MMERIVKFTPAWDKRDKGFGRHGVDLRMVLKGPRGAMQFVLSTHWGIKWDSNFFLVPLPVDVGYHSPVPQYEGQVELQSACPYLDGKPCYYDGSGLRAHHVFDILTEKGSDGVWAYLQEEYDAMFGKEEEGEVVTESTDGDGQGD